MILPKSKVNLSQKDGGVEKVPEEAARVVQSMKQLAEKLPQPEDSMTEQNTTKAHKIHSMS